MTLSVIARRRISTIAIILFSVLLTHAVFADHANIGSSDFEIETDANLTVETADHFDWGNVAENSNTDAPSGSGDDAFGQGSKEDTPAPSPVTGSIPPNKSDLKTFGVYLEDDGTNRYLHLFWHRVQDPSGTTNMDFEFNQSEVTSSNGVTPVRTAGDALIQYDLANGGTNPELFLSRWIDGSEDPPMTSNDCEAASKLPCWGTKLNLTQAAVARGSINTSFIAGADSDGLAPDTGIDPRTFGEATIDFNALSDISGGGCTSFGSAYLKSRSSDSFTSALKDFIAPISADVDNCATLKITKLDDTTPGVPLPGAQFEVWVDNDPNDGAAPKYDVDGVAGDGDREPNYTCTTDLTPLSCKFTGVLAGKYWVVEVLAPSGHDLANPAFQLVNIVAGGNDVEATFINPRKPASVTITKTDDATPANPLAGATFTLFVDDAPSGYDAGDTTVEGSCVTGADGKCTISNILPPGNFCLVETVVPTGYNAAAPQCFSLSLDENKSVSFVNTRKPASVTITKTDDDSPANPLAGATFTLYVDDAPAGYDAGDTTVKGSCATAADGMCTISNVLPPGDYCLVETVVPSGYDAASPQCFSLAFDESKSVSFVDPRHTGAILITKTRKHAASGPGDHPHAGVTFTVTGGDLPAVGQQVVTAADGTVCLDGLLLSSFVGAYSVTETVPGGYTAIGDTSKSVTVSQKSTCGDGDEATVSFANMPLTDITVSVSSQVSGGTQSTIECKLGETTVGAISTWTENPSVNLTSQQPGTYICTIVVDP